PHYPPLPMRVVSVRAPSKQPTKQPTLSPSIPALPSTLGVIQPGSLGQVVLADRTVDPLDATAKLYFNEPNDPPNAGWSCSAEFVGDSGDVLMTAGHCVFDNSLGAWNRNWRIYQQYDQGTSLQALSWQCVGVYSGWAQGNWPRDYAFIKVAGTSTRAMGLAVGVPSGQWTSIGYPAAYYNAERLVRVDGT